MKKNYIGILMTLLTLGFSSCSSDQSTPKEEPDLLIAKWTLDKSSFNGVSNTLTACGKQAYYEFKSNNSFERSYFWMNGNNCESEGIQIGTYTYNKADKKIVLSYIDLQDGPQEQTLNKVNITTSTFSYSWDEDNNGTDDIYAEYKK